MRYFRVNFFKGRECGGAAIEYVVVSLFGLVLAGVAVGFVSKTVKAKLQQIEEKLGLELDEDELDVW